MNEQQGNMTAIEGNKLIAEFMGAEIVASTKSPNGFMYKYRIRYNECVVDYHYFDDKWNGYGDGCLKFNSSFDWLMLVVEKIEQIEKTAFQYQSFENGKAQILLSVDGTVQAGCMFDKGQQKEAYYNVVVQFVKWYNSQSPDKQQQL